jgi:hypothetical protein|nr:MAG TPA: tail assembly chaperone protein [Caudoviricetes sp.]
MGLNSFLKQNVVEKEHIKIAVSDRFLREDGKPELWELKAISTAENEKLKNSCTKDVPIPGQRGAYRPEIDYNGYLLKLSASCIVYPDLNNKELQDSYGVMGAEKVLERMLIPGEYTDLLAEIQKINGFDVSLADKVEEAKN